jgi:hypothetical protein
MTPEEYAYQNIWGVVDNKNIVVFKLDGNYYMTEWRGIKGWSYPSTVHFVEECGEVKTWDIA